MTELFKEFEWNLRFGFAKYILENVVNNNQAPTVSDKIKKLSNNNAHIFVSQNDHCDGKKIY